MATPVVAGTASSVESADVTSHDVTLPASIAAGDVVLVFIAVDGSGNESISLTSTPGPLTWEQGWVDELESAGHNFGLRWRVADGSEGTTATFTTANAQESAHQSYRITGADAVDATRTESSSATTTPDPPSHTPAGGAQDYLWIACFGADNGNDVSAYPTDFTDGMFTESAGAGPVSLGTARRALNAASLDPGSFTIAGSDDWSAATVAVHPADVAAVTVKHLAALGVG